MVQCLSFSIFCPVTTLIETVVCSIVVPTPTPPGRYFVLAGHSCRRQFQGTGE
jgi:hypothetical protein